MVDQAYRYRLRHPEVDPFDENIAGLRSENALRVQAPPDPFRDSSVPLFLSDPEGEPDPRTYLAPLRQKRRISISSRLLAAVVAAAGVAVVFAMVSSDAMRDNILSLKASIAAVLPTPLAAAQADPSPTQRGRQLSGFSQPSAPANPDMGAGSVAVAAVAPTREEIKNAYQNALQGGAEQSSAPQATPVTESMISANAIRHLEPDEIASALARGAALIGSGDIAAARLVLRRAAEAGDAHAVMTLAETYDPAFLEKLGVHGVVPDLAKAQDWYEKAKQFGATEATQRLELLASRQH